ncbi:PR domain zinc finger protein 10-like protein [Dinothrombium tinctorium]|uniref:PR domain zinc finger protein 10-like protein n=1 Tax=Dinothrombium tinctorium TaxID=1965070 RepID=A0A3S3PJS8_9ACAR|nr:PR domain zinc finger protein 10-like protein [Dinothrombium tinctorium]
MAVFTTSLQEMAISSTVDATDESDPCYGQLCATIDERSAHSMSALSDSLSPCSSALRGDVSPSQDSTTSQHEQHEIVIADVPILSRARASLPTSYLVIEQVHESGANGSALVYGVFARKSVPQKTQFGPVEGVITEYNSACLKQRQQPNLIVYINDTMILDQSDENTSNWMRFVRTARTIEEQNLILVAKDQTQPNPENSNELITITKFFFMTTRAINAYEELKVWYSSEYLERFKVNIIAEQQLTSPSSFHLSSDDDQNRSNAIMCSDLSTVAAGHKLRNKIAKSQQQQQQNVQVQKINSDDGETNDQVSSQNENNCDRLLTNVEQPQYKCDICQKVFPRPYSLRRHKIMHSGEKKFKCSTCGMCFSDVYNRNRHAKRHAKNNPRKSFSRFGVQIKESNQNSPSLTASKIDQNYQSENNEPTEFASEASEEPESTAENSSHQSPTVINSFDSEKQFLPVAKKSTPLNTNDTQNCPQNKPKCPNLRPKPYRCLQCYKSFTTDDRLLRHAIVHTSDEQVKPLACQICDKRFLNNSALSCHLKVHSTSKDEPRRYDCVICKQWFDCTQTRKDHIQTHADPETGQFTCPTCTKRFDEFTAIRKHIRAFHSDKQYPCTQCEKVFPRPDKLKLHMLRHSDHREFLCQNCGKQFKRKDKLKEHMQRMHAPDREAKLAAAKHAQQMNNNHKKFIPKVSPTDYHRFIYKCHTCLLGFKRRGMLVNHLAKRHPDIPPETVPELNLPILKTTRDYYCQYCEKIYKSSSKRKAHILKNHPGGVPVIPGIPNPTYSATVGSITTHPHYCDWCHKQYASKAKLLQHQRKKHPEKISIINASVRSRNRIDLNTTDTSNMSTTQALTNLSNVSDTSSLTTSSLTPSTLSNSIIDTASNCNVQTSLANNANLITILGNIGNLNSIIATVSSSDSDFHELLQANPSAANDLLTQAMSELTQTRDNTTGDQASATLIVPVNDSDVVSWT